MFGKCQMMGNCEKNSGNEVIGLKTTNELDYWTGFERLNIECTVPPVK